MEVGAHCTGWSDTPFLPLLTDWTSHIECVTQVQVHVQPKVGKWMHKICHSMLFHPLTDLSGKLLLIMPPNSYQSSSCLVLRCMLLNSRQYMPGIICDLWVFYFFLFQQEGLSYQSPLQVPGQFAFLEFRKPGQKRSLFVWGQNVNLDTLTLDEMSANHIAS